MPIHLPPTSRRSFLHGLAVGGASLALPRLRASALDGPAPYVALLADTHIDADPAKVVHADKVNMSDHLRAVVDDILAQPTPPAAVAVVGDLALKNGKPGDYAQFLKLVAPLRDRGLPVHLTLGNHDDRGPLREALKAEADDAVEGRFVTAVDAAGVRLVLLDSAALLEILRPRKQVKALVFGHTHTWRREERDGLHLVNLPAVGYHFEKPQPLGWCRLEPARDDTGATLALRCVAGDRSKDGERVELSWRGA